jgi:hypothetical protein
MVLTVPSKDQMPENPINLDSAKFWAKVELPSGKTGFLPTEVTVDQNDHLTLICPRPVEGVFTRLFPPKPLAEGSIFSLSFNDGKLFELWSSEVISFVGTNEAGLDRYEISSVRQEMSSSERFEERLVVSVPLKLKTKNKFSRIFSFTGCELGTKGLGLWLPNSAKSKITIDQTYELIFEPKEVEPFSFEVKCVRPICEDSFTKGFVAGFVFTDTEEGKLATVRLQQLLNARGRLPEPNLKVPGHYLASFWDAEYLGAISK